MDAGSSQPTSFPIFTHPTTLQAAVSGRLTFYELPCGTTWADAFRDSRTLTVKQATLTAHPQLLELYPSTDVPITVFAVSDRAYVNVAASFRLGPEMPALDSLESQMVLGKVRVGTEVVVERAG